MHSKRDARDNNCFREKLLLIQMRFVVVWINYFLFDIGFYSACLAHSFIAILPLEFSSTFSLYCFSFFLFFTYYIIAYFW